jgi:hypothetical protein
MKTSRSPSRLMPARHFPGLRLPAKLFVVGLVLGIAYPLYLATATTRWLALALVCGFAVSVAVANRREARRFERLADARRPQSICTFARDFDPRAVDTWILRATHQELQLLLRSYVPAFPIRAADKFSDLGIDTDDVEDLIRDIAWRCGRSLERTEGNPFYGKLITVENLVLFVNAQPRAA